jgi:translation initiation factor 4G
MLRRLITLLFDKALAESNFGHIYAKLCVKLHENSASAAWTFIKVIVNDDEGKFYWTCDSESNLDPVAGPYQTPDDAVEAGSFGIGEEGSEFEMAAMNPPAENMQMQEIRIREGRFVKVLQGESGFFFSGGLTVEDTKRTRFVVGPYPDEEQAVKNATKQTSFKRILLNQCQEEFEKDSQYDDLEKERASKLATLEGNELRLQIADFELERIKVKRRVLGNIRFIGELYKMSMLQERIMHECVHKLLHLDVVVDNEERRKRVVRREGSKPDEEDLESLCKLLGTVGKMIDAQSRDMVSSSKSRKASGSRSRSRSTASSCYDMWCVMT